MRTGEKSAHPLTLLALEHEYNEVVTSILLGAGCPTAAARHAHVNKTIYVTFSALYIKSDHACPICKFDKLLWNRVPAAIACTVGICAARADNCSAEQHTCTVPQTLLGCPASSALSRTRASCLCLPLDVSHRHRHCRQAVNRSSCSLNRR